MEKISESAYSMVLLRRDLPIVSMTEQKKSLEEVFLELTESEAKIRWYQR